MGVIERLVGGGAAAVGGAVTDVAEVFRANATKRLELEHEAFEAALDQQKAEFSHAGSTWFDRVINGLNRLPRPLLALGTLGLFSYAMVDPVRFAARMEGLGYVPEPLWWLLGAIVSFYFGARELHYRRARPRRASAPAGDRNAALSAWHNESGK